MGLSYYVGALTLCLLQNKNFTDAQCLKIGAILTLSSLILPISLYLLIKETLYGLFIPFFSFGFALFTPSLFSMLSKVKRLDEQGKIYGLLDLTDTVSVLISTKLIKNFNKINYNTVFGSSLTILIVSYIFVFIFIKHMRNIRKTNELASKKSRNSE